MNRNELRPLTRDEVDLVSGADMTMSVGALQIRVGVHGFAVHVGGQNGVGFSVELQPSTPAP